MTVEPRGAAENDVQNVSVSERKHKVFFPMDVLLGRVIHVVFCLQETCFLPDPKGLTSTHQVSAKWIGIFIFLRRILVLPAITMARSVSLSMLSNGNPIANTR